MIRIRTPHAGELAAAIIAALHSAVPAAWAQGGIEPPLLAIGTPTLDPFTLGEPGDEPPLWGVRDERSPKPGAAFAGPSIRDDQHRGGTSPASPFARSGPFLHDAGLLAGSFEFDIEIASSIGGMSGELLDAAAMAWLLERDPDHGDDASIPPARAEHRLVAAFESRAGSPRGLVEAWSLDIARDPLAISHRAGSDGRLAATPHGPPADAVPSPASALPLVLAVATLPTSRRRRRDVRPRRRACA